MRALRFALVPALLLGLAAIAARAVPLEQIPSPRPIGWVADQASLLPAQTLVELNRLGDEVKNQGAEMAVVVVNSTDGVDSHEFATRLYNAWGISGRGFLVFVALADRKAEIILGDATLSEEARQQSQIVMNVEMIPRFRTGDPAGAVLAGARECARRILGVSVAPEATATQEPSPVPAPPSASAGSSLYEAPSPAPELNMAGAIGGLLLLLCVGGLFVGFLVLLLRAPRCRRCKQKMTLLEESQDDARLNENEQLEERLGSVDYKIWVCPACGELKKTSSVRWFSGYQNCPRCAVRALKVDSWTVEEATYDHGGLVRTDENCAKCAYHNSYTRSTPRRVRTESRSYSSTSSSSVSSASAFRSSSSSSSSSSSGSRSSGSSSSSSSGSGFSGGSSSGGGASGSW